MTSSYTPNKRLEQPALNDYVGDWNLTVNGSWSVIDTCFGGYLILNPTGQSGVIPLTSTTNASDPHLVTAQWQPPNLIIGASATTAATLTANVNYQLPTGVGGQWSIYNNTTGAFTVTFSSASGGTSVVLPQGYSSVVICDGTNVRFSSSSTPTFASNNFRLLGATSGYVGLQAPATSSNPTFTLPAADGAAGQYAKTDGSGNLSFTSVGAFTTLTTSGLTTHSADAVYGNFYAPTGVLSLGYRGIPQIGGGSKTASYTLALADAGGHVYLTGAATGQVVTIPANSAIAYPIGTAVTIVNNASQPWSLAITTDTLTLVGTGVTGTRTLAAYAMVTILKVTATSWFVSGAGIT